jgi:hypothetical protein
MSKTFRRNDDDYYEENRNIRKFRKEAKETRNLRMNMRNISSNTVGNREELEDVEVKF